MRLQKDLDLQNTLYLGKYSVKDSLQCEPSSPQCPKCKFEEFFNIAEIVPKGSLSKHCSRLLNSVRKANKHRHQIYFFRQITTFIKVRVAFVFGLQNIYLIHFTKIYELKGLKPINKGHTNFYECCDLTKKVYLICIYY